MITLVIVLIIITVVAIFSIQNSKPAEISLLLWKFEASLAIVIFLSVLTGALIASIISASVYFKRHARKKSKIVGQ